MSISENIPDEMTANEIDTSANGAEKRESDAGNQGEEPFRDWTENETNSANDEEDDEREREGSVDRLSEDDEPDVRLEEAQDEETAGERDLGDEHAGNQPTASENDSSPPAKDDPSSSGHVADADNGPAANAEDRLPSNAPDSHEQNENVDNHLSDAAEQYASTSAEDSSGDNDAEPQPLDGEGAKVHSNNALAEVNDNPQAAEGAGSSANNENQARDPAEPDAGGASAEEAVSDTISRSASASSSRANLVDKKHSSVAGHSAEDVNKSQNFDSADTASDGARAPSFGESDPRPVLSTEDLKEADTRDMPKACGEPADAPPLSDYRKDDSARNTQEESEEPAGAPPLLTDQQADGSQDVQNELEQLADAPLSDDQALREANLGEDPAAASTGVDDAETPIAEDSASTSRDDITKVSLRGLSDPAYTNPQSRSSSHPALSLPTRSARPSAPDIRAESQRDLVSSSRSSSKTSLGTSSHAASQTDLADTAMTTRSTRGSRAALASSQTRRTESSQKLATQRSSSNMLSSNSQSNLALSTSRSDMATSGSVRRSTRQFVDAELQDDDSNGGSGEGDAGSLTRDLDDDDDGRAIAGSARNFRDSGHNAADLQAIRTLEAELELLKMEKNEVQARLSDAENECLLHASAIDKLATTNAELSALLAAEANGKAALAREVQDLSEALAFVQVRLEEAEIRLLLDKALDLKIKLKAYTDAAGLSGNTTPRMAVTGGRVPLSTRYAKLPDITPPSLSGSQTRLK
ncbi:hypothetical protein HDU87_002633 [Geranomyces variabilis]|uniref:Uncharacterized protein n=1 Tax=Geranomyces variabilis TaxID=109894 RepID=A0AAD5TUF8_9FUNG|nr:hypothetical protein HDU87_002633 [Geranomyces variabilis]